MKASYFCNFLSILLSILCTKILEMIVRKMFQSNAKILFGVLHSLIQIKKDRLFMRGEAGAIWHYVAIHRTTLKAFEEF